MQNLLQPLAQKTRTQAAKKAGMSGPTYGKAKAVVEAAKADPERCGDLPAKMDVNGNVEGAFKAMQRRHPCSPR